MEQLKQEIPSRWTAALLRVPDAHVDPDFLARCGGALYESVFFDDSVNVHICSLTPSVGFEVLELVAGEYPENEDAREALYDELMEVHSSSEGFYYMDRSDVERLKKANPENFKNLGDFDVDEDENACEVVREYLQGNPVF